MSEVITRPEGNTAVALSSSGSDRWALAFSAMSNPEVDTTKFELMLSMMYRHEDRERQLRLEDDQRAAEVAATAAMNAVQAEMAEHPILRDARNNETKSRYAKLESIMRVLQPIYTRHGFALSFAQVPPEEKGNVKLEVKVSHSTNPPGPCVYSFARSLEVRIDNIGIKGAVNKTEVHGFMSSITYLRRYLATLVFNIVTEGDDDDANAAGQRRPDRDPPPPPPPPRFSDWILAREDEFVTEDNPDKWLALVFRAFAQAPNRAELLTLAALPCLTESRQKAPEAIRERIDAAYNAALARFTDSQRDTGPQPNPKNGRSCQPDAPQGRADPGWPGYEAVAIDAYGEADRRIHENPVSFASLIADFWRGTPKLSERRSLLEYNADSIDEARQLSREADRILAPLIAQAAPDAAPDAGQTKSMTKEPPPPPVIVEPPTDRGKVSWPGYLRAIKVALAEQTPTTIHAWAEAQRDTIASAPLAQRVLAIGTIAQRMDPPPRWLGELMHPPKAADTDPADDDATWIELTVGDLAAMQTIAEFDSFTKSPVVQATMRRLQSENRPLFDRGNAAFVQAQRRLTATESQGHHR